MTRTQCDGITIVGDAVGTLVGDAVAPVFVGTFVGTFVGETVGASVEHMYPPLGARCPRAAAPIVLHLHTRI
jgi:hypothetical protein